MEKLVLVHLSDVHFTGSSGNVHDVDQNVRDELLRDVAEITKKLGGATGDRFTHHEEPDRSVSARAK